MLNQKKIEIFLTKIRKSLAKQFLEIAFSDYGGWLRRNYEPTDLRTYGVTEWEYGEFLYFLYQLLYFVFRR